MLSMNNSVFNYLYLNVYTIGHIVIQVTRTAIQNFDQFIGHAVASAPSVNLFKNGYY